MAAFVNLAADPVGCNILEARIGITCTLEDTLTRIFYAIFHYHKVAGSGAPDLATWLGNFGTTVNDRIVPFFNVRLTGAFNDVRPLDDPFSMAIVNTPSQTAGVVTGDPLSAALAVNLKLESGVRGRSFQGRKHLSGFSESDTDGGDELKASIISSFQTQVTNAFGAISDGSGATYNPCVLSPTLSRIFDTPPIFTGADIVSATVNPILGTMRKRKEKVPA